MQQSSQVNSNSSSLLPQDKDLREDLLLKLEELKAHPAYLVVRQRLLALQQLSLRELESATELHRLHRLQGEVASYRKALSALDDIEQELKRG